MPIYGYARVSSPDQTLVGQDAELHKAGAAKVYREKISGAAGAEGVRADPAEVKAFGIAP